MKWHMILENAWIATFAKYHKCHSSDIFAAAAGVPQVWTETLTEPWQWFSAWRQPTGSSLRWVSQGPEKRPQLQAHTGHWPGLKRPETGHLKNIGHWGSMRPPRRRIHCSHGRLCDPKAIQDPSGASEEGREEEERGPPHSQVAWIPLLLSSTWSSSPLFGLNLNLNFSNLISSGVSFFDNFRKKTPSTPTPDTASTSSHRWVDLIDRTSYVSSSAAGD